MAIQLFCSRWGTNFPDHAKKALVCASPEDVVCGVQGHRLVLLAEKEGKASQAEEMLFEAIYEKGLNISDSSTLEQIGEELQLPEVKLLPCDCIGNHQTLASEHGGRCRTLIQHVRQHFMYMANPADQHPFLMHYLCSWYAQACTTDPGRQKRLMQVKSFLQSSEGKAEVLQRDREAKQQLNIHGVPHFLVGAADRQERTSLHGAQSTAALSHAIQQAAA